MARLKYTEVRANKRLDWLSGDPVELDQNGWKPVRELTPQMTALIKVVTRRWPDISIDPPPFMLDEIRKEMGLSNRLELQGLFAQPLVKHVLKQRWRALSEPPTKPAGANGKAEDHPNAGEIMTLEEAIKVVSDIARGVYREERISGGEIFRIRPSAKTVIDAAIAIMKLHGMHTERVHLTGEVSVTHELNSRASAAVDRLVNETQKPSGKKLSNRKDQKLSSFDITEFVEVEEAPDLQPEQGDDDNLLVSLDDLIGDVQKGSPLAKIFPGVTIAKEKTNRQQKQKK